MKTVNEEGNPRPEYCVWAAMVQRCCNPKNRAFSYYGARGIKVCEAWRLFANFFADMGSRPSDSHTLDRKDNNGNYEPSNCRWTDRQTQMRNRRSNTFLELNGERKLLCEWATQYGISAALICNRMNKMSWSVERAITTPADKSKYTPRSGMTAHAKTAGIKLRTVRGRLERGWSLERALSR
jgi:hypothetical protein